MSDKLGLDKEIEDRVRIYRRRTPKTALECGMARFRFLASPGKTRLMQRCDVFSLLSAACPSFPVILTSAFAFLHVVTNNSCVANMTRPWNGKQSNGLRL